MPVPSPSRELPERYEVERHLADGGMASVWEATDRVLGRRVAVKLLAHPYADDPAARARFEREARAAARVSTHPNVVTVYDAGTVGDSAYLVMALYPGGTVRDRLRAGAVDRPTALGWLADAAAGLDAAHAAGVVHRDVKPGNLLLDERDRLAVGDFGIATAAWVASVTQTGLVVGTMAYLSPEQRAGRPATAASDVWALTMVAHELLTGRPTDAPLGQGLPHAARAVLERGLDADPDRRPSTGAALVDELRAALGPGEDPTAATRVMDQATQRLPVSGRSPAAAATAPRRARAPEPMMPPAPHRSRRPLATLLAVLALLGVGGVVAAIAAGGGGGDDGRSQTDGGATSTSRSTTATRARSTGSASTPAPAASAGPGPAPTTAAPATSTGPGSSGSGAAGGATGSSGSTSSGPGSSSATSGASGAALDARAKRLLDAGDPAAAVPVARQAVARLSARPSELAYAYALFNLARALRLSGDPQEALSVLRTRQQVAPGNQPGTVDAEIAAAQRAIRASDGDG